MIRNAEKPLIGYLDGTDGPFKTLIVQGARQVGKSTLVQQVLSRRPHVALNLETNRSLRNEIDQTTSFAEFSLLLNVKYGFEPGQILFIDEAQESLRLGSYVREMKETWQKSKVILTGSSMSKLFADDVRIPVGRVEYLTIHPFSFREFLRWQQKEGLLEEALGLLKQQSPFPDFLHQELLRFFDSYLKQGGLPEVVKAGALFRDVQNEIFLSQKEDFMRKEKSDPYLFSDALKGVANHVGFPSKYTHVAANQYQAKGIMAKLQEWNLVYEVTVQGSQTTQSISQKRYAYDMGILQYLRNIPVPEIHIIETLNEAQRQPLGGILENAVLLNYLSQIKTPGPLSTWKKNAKAPIEVDFVFNYKSKKIPIEVKAALRFQDRHAKNVVEYLHRYDLFFGLVMSLDKPKKIEIGGLTVWNVPAYLPLASVLTYASSTSTLGV